MSEKRPSRRKPRAEAAPASGSPMDVRLLEQIVKLMAANDLNTVEVRDGDRRVTLKRGAAPSVIVASSAPPPAAGSVPPQPAAGSGLLAASDEEAGFLRIKSPMVGTFYAAPAKGAKPFVTVGSAVEDDTDVCIIEAMKVFNNIKAECHGTVARVLVQDGQPVEFGTVLFLVKPD